MDNIAKFQNGVGWREEYDDLLMAELSRVTLLIDSLANQICFERVCKEIAVAMSNVYGNSINKWCVRRRLHANRMYFNLFMQFPEIPGVFFKYDINKVLVDKKYWAKLEKRGRHVMFVTHHNILTLYARP